MTKRVRNKKGQFIKKWVKVTKQEWDYLKSQCSVTDAELFDALCKYEAEVDAKIKSGELNAKEFLDSQDDVWDNEQNAWIKPERKKNQFSELDDPVFISGEDWREFCEGAKRQLEAFKNSFGD
jgi:hypothetical protein